MANCYTDYDIYELYSYRGEPGMAHHLLEKPRAPDEMGIALRFTAVAEDLARGI